MDSKLIEKIEKLGKKKDLKKLQKYFKEELDKDVLAAVFKAIGSVKNPEAVAVLCETMHNDNRDIRFMSAEALAVAAAPSDLEKLRHFADIEEDAEIKGILSNAALALKAAAPAVKSETEGKDY